MVTTSKPDNVVKTEPLKLQVDKIFKSAEKESTIFVPTIVLAECLYLVENKKTDLI